MMTRDLKKKTILLTGATGFLGGQVADRLKRDGHRLICLVRGENARDRVERLVSRLESQDQVISCDLSTDSTAWRASLSPLKGTVDQVVHCAGLVKFHDYLADEIFKTNVDGTRHLLGLATDLGIPEFHYVSTAYVAGDAERFSEFDRDKGQATRNPYEASKLEAERHVAAWEGGRYSIYRPSVIVGDQETGQSQSGTGFYGIHAVFERFKRFLMHVFSVDGVEYREAGIYFDSNQVLNLPLNIRASETSTINFIPVDWVGKMMNELMKQPAVNAVYHLVHPDPPGARWIFETSLELFGIRGMRFGQEEAPHSEILDRLQRLLDKNLGIYDPYLNRTEAKFDDAAIRSALGGRYCVPPKINREFLGHLLRHAVYQEEPGYIPD